MLQIAISALQPDLKGPFEVRFGRAPYFILVDPQDLSWEILDNREQASGPSAGIQTARRLANHGVQVVVTGRVGPHAAAVLQAAGIKVIETDAPGSAQQALQVYLRLAGASEKV